MPNSLKLKIGHPVGDLFSSSAPRNYGGTRGVTHTPLHPGLNFQKVVKFGPAGKRRGVQRIEEPRRANSITRIDFKASYKEKPEMLNRKIVASVGKGGGKSAGIRTLSHCPLWSNVRFASPPGLKENNL